MGCNGECVSTSGDEHSHVACFPSEGQAQGLLPNAHSKHLTLLSDWDCFGKLRRYLRVEMSNTTGNFPDAVWVNSLFAKTYFKDKKSYHYLTHV